MTVDDPIAKFKKAFSSSDESPSKGNEDQVEDPVERNEVQLAEQAIEDLRKNMLEQDLSAKNRDKLATLCAAMNKDMEEKVRKAKKLILCDSLDEMAGPMAIDEGTSPEAAKARMVKNNCRGFTAEKTGQVYLLRGDCLIHDTIHEMVHLCSAKGGQTKILAQCGEKVNEGFTELITREIVKESGQEEKEAYPTQRQAVESLKTLVGWRMIHEAYMQNKGIEPIVTILAGKWEKRGARWREKDHRKAEFAPPEEASAREDEIRVQITDERFFKDGVAFIRNRC